MNRSLRIVVALLTLGLFCVSSMLLAARTDAEIVADQISKKIELLGHEQYTVRDQAEQQLIEMGMAAFDQLLAATEHDDLEIASRASYLLPRLKIQWISEQDSEVVRDLMREYSVDVAGRSGRMHSLASQVA